VAYLLDDRARNVTGSVLTVDAGATARDKKPPGAKPGGVGNLDNRTGVILTLSCDGGGVALAKMRRIFARARGGRLTVC
jgi:hypothetical protein